MDLPTDEVDEFLAVVPRLRSAARWDSAIRWIVRFTLRPVPMAEGQGGHLASAEP
jgi:hypothetical protein